MDQTRYAIYYTPSPDSPLGRFGARWFSSADGDAKPLAIAGMDQERIHEITKTARSYGFHGTLKPPFRLVEGADFPMLDTALEHYAAQQAPFVVPPLELAVLDGFVALRPKQQSRALNGLADSCVKAFDSFREPPSEHELEKRLQGKLTDNQKQLLISWGYPYVMDEFRFHMTLTERLDSQEQALVTAGLTEYLASILDARPWTLDRLSVLRQDRAGQCSRA